MTRQIDFRVVRRYGIRIKDIKTRLLLFFAYYAVTKNNGLSDIPMVYFTTKAFNTFKNRMT